MPSIRSDGLGGTRRSDGGSGRSLGEGAASVIGGVTVPNRPRPRRSAIRVRDRGGNAPFPSPERGEGAGPNPERGGGGSPLASPPMLHLYDTAQRRVVPFEPRTPGKVSMYVCGPTVYGPPHLGHGRFALVFDILRRYLEWSGFEVTYVSNITDIDDKIIARAAEEQRPWQEVTEEYEKVWFDAMDRINVRRPDEDPHA